MGNSKVRVRKQRLKVGMLLLCCFVLWVGYIFGKGVVSTYQLNHDINKRNLEMKAIKMRNDVLRAEIEHMQSPEYIERIAREELGLVKPDETLYILSQPLVEGAGISVEKSSNPAGITD